MSNEKEEEASKPLPLVASKPVPPPGRQVRIERDVFADRDMVFYSRRYAYRDAYIDLNATRRANRKRLWLLAVLVFAAGAVAGIAATAAFWGWS